MKLTDSIKELNTFRASLVLPLSLTWAS